MSRAWFEHTLFVLVCSGRHSLPCVCVLQGSFASIQHRTAMTHGAGGVASELSNTLTPTPSSMQQQHHQKFGWHCPASHADGLPGAYGMLCYAASCCAQVLGKNHVIKTLDKCDFTPIYDHLMAERDKKKNMTKEVRG